MIGLAAAAVALTFCTPAPATMRSQPSAVVESFVAAWRQRDFEGLAAYIAKDAVVSLYDWPKQTGAEYLADLGEMPGTVVSRRVSDDGVLLNTTFEVPCLLISGSTVSCEPLRRERSLEFRVVKGCIVGLNMQWGRVE